MDSDENQSPIELIATTAFGLEAIVGRELKNLGYESQTIQPAAVNQGWARKPSVS